MPKKRRGGGCDGEVRNDGIDGGEEEHRQAALQAVAEGAELEDERDVLPAFPVPTVVALLLLGALDTKVEGRGIPSEARGVAEAHEELQPQREGGPNDDSRPSADPLQRQRQPLVP